MLALTLPESEIKGFMGKLLREDMFDGFDVKSVLIESFARFEVGLAADANGERLSWAQIRPFAFEVIKNGGKPALVKVVLALSQAEAEALFPEAKALFINITFENGGVMITTGSSEKAFSLERKLERAWDEHARGILAGKGVRFDEA